MSLELIHLTVAIFFTLGVDAYAIFKFLKWNLRKACAVSLLINFVSMIAAFMAQQYLVTKLPSDWFFLYHISNNYATIFLIFSTVTIVVKILMETLIISFFDKEISTANLWVIVVVMNIITAVPGSIYDFIRGCPKIQKPFVLSENADWIHVSENNIYFLAAKTKMLTKATPGTDKYYPLTAAEPFYGYRISDDGSAVITLGRTNSVTISVIISNELSHSYIYPSHAKTVDLIDAVPEKNILAICISNQLKCLNLQTGSLTGEIVELPEDNFDNISIGINSSKVICSLGTNKISANWISGTISDIANEKTSLSWICSMENYVFATNSFHSDMAEINVVMNKGMEINFNGEISEFNVKTTARYIGIGFLDDGENFLFQLGGEILVINVKTKKVGHLYEGILAIISN